MMGFTCRLCAGASARLIRATDAKAGGPLPIAFCEGCGLVRQAELPDAESLRIYYAHTYRQDYKGVHTPKPKHVRRAGTAALSRLAFLRSADALRPGLRLLDIGAGGGEFVYMAGRSGLAAEGIEPNVGYSEFAQAEYGVRIRTMPIDDLAQASAELVTMFHVLEHLADPLAAFERIHAVLEPEGLLFIEVPNLLQADASPHNVWFKAHLYYYSRFTLQAAASRWFEPLVTQDPGNLRMLLKRRAQPLAAPQLPGPEEVALAWQRLQQKGWLEYLFTGGGLGKPWRRIRRMLGERRVAGQGPRAVLDDLFQAATPG